MELYRLPGTNVQAAEIAKAIEKNWQLGRVTFRGMYNENVQILKQKGYEVHLDYSSIVEFAYPPTYTITWNPEELSSTSPE
jgi:hypothetical protein